MRDELTDSATFQVIVSPLENIPGIPTKALSAEFHELFKAVLLLHRHPRTLIQLVVQTTSKPPVATPTVNLSMNQPQEASSSEAKEPEKRRAPLLLGPDMPFEASEIAASINASTLALIDAAIPLRATVIATSCAVLEIDDALRTRDVDPSQKSHWCVAPTYPVSSWTLLPKRKRWPSAATSMRLLFPATMHWMHRATMNPRHSSCTMLALAARRPSSARSCSLQRRMLHSRPFPTSVTRSPRG